MAAKKTATKQSKGHANPKNLAPTNGGKVKGGLAVKLENVQITSYQLG